MQRTYTTVENRLESERQRKGRRLGVTELADHLQAAHVGSIIDAFVENVCEFHYSVNHPIQWLQAKYYATLNFIQDVRTAYNRG